MNEEKARLLIVDDDDEIRNILYECLTRSYECVLSSSAAEALALLERESFDLIMSDINMPQMTGLEMMSYLTNLAPDSIVVMISGQRMIESAIEAMRAGAFDYITKPFELGQVAEVVSRALRYREALPISRSRATQRAAGAERLRRALVSGDLRVHYQPQVEIHSRRVVGAEALVRWQDPERGLRMPADFIPLAEETGLVVPLGETVLRAACAQARTWHQRGLTRFRVAVNVSPQQLQQDQFPERVGQILEAAGLAAQYLEIEVTETSLMNDSEVGIRALTILRKMGVKIAIDDFGTGYSSLGYLRRLPIDSVKLDASFVKDATSDPDAAALVMAIITLAHNLRLKVIAEGIEREEQSAFLRLLRCDEGQGYFFGRPASPDKLALPFIQRQGDDESVTAKSPLMADNPRGFCYSSN